MSVYPILFIQKYILDATLSNDDISSSTAAVAEKLFKKYLCPCN